MQAEIELSDKAALKVQHLIEEEGDTSLCLRVFITGGGCNGFSYGFTFDDAQADDDAVIEKKWRAHAGGCHELSLPGGC